MRQKWKVENSRRLKELTSSNDGGVVGEAKWVKLLDNRKLRTSTSYKLLYSSERGAKLSSLSAFMDRDESKNVSTLHLAWYEIPIYNIYLYLYVVLIRDNLLYRGFHL